MDLNLDFVHTGKACHDPKVEGIRILYADIRNPLLVEKALNQKTVETEILCGGNLDLSSAAKAARLAKWYLAHA
jgi:hypothetical protein